MSGAIASATWLPGKFFSRQKKMVFNKNWKIAHPSRSKKIYDIGKGNVLLLMNSDAPLMKKQLEKEYEALAAIKKHGIRVVSHKWVTVVKEVEAETEDILLLSQKSKRGKKQTKTKEVPGLIEKNLKGTFVHIANLDADALIKAITSGLPVKKRGKAVKKLIGDISVIQDQWPDFKIDDLQGYLLNDGHFVVMDPLAVGSNLDNEKVRGVPDKLDALLTELRTYV